MSGRRSRAGVLARRTSGVLLPVTALPSRFGAGDLGGAARAFGETLFAAEQSIWQVLPLGEVDAVGSPYASPSAFAGNARLIDPWGLTGDGLLSAAEVRAWERMPGRVTDPAYAARCRAALLPRAYAAFTGGADYEAFLARERYWLKDYALFDALKEHFGGAPFFSWEEGARRRERAYLRDFAEANREKIAYRYFMQYVFDRQLASLRAYLAARGITLLGDIPFYVAPDSADVWAHPELFSLTARGRVRLAAGVPPDYFSPLGQLWGNPVYDWDAAAEDGYRWWLARLSRARRMYGALRLDHFRAFDSYYTVRLPASDARTGRWRRGPGRPFFDAVARRVPDLALLAEDLGGVTPGVHELRRYAGIPGMRVMQFAFGAGADNAFLPHNYARETAAYLGTHDNDTTARWWRLLDAPVRAHAAEYLGIPASSPPREAVVRMIGTLSASVADTVIFTVQDLTGVGERINTPGVTEGSWRYAAREEVLDADAAALLLRVTRLYGRSAAKTAENEGVRDG